MVADKSARRQRRVDLARMRAKARAVYPHDPKARLAEHLANCSCWMCGNPRRTGKAERLTIQERRRDEADRLTPLAPRGDDA